MAHALQMLLTGGAHASGGADPHCHRLSPALLNAPAVAMLLHPRGRRRRWRRRRRRSAARA
ncbi:hypothetical protein ABBQ32_003744 [Trebouxia sp. C0010 RCD-2024]